MTNPPPKPPSKRKRIAFWISIVSALFAIPAGFGLMMVAASSAKDAAPPPIAMLVLALHLSYSVVALFAARTSKHPLLHWRTILLSQTILGAGFVLSISIQRLLFDLDNGPVKLPEAAPQSFLEELSINPVVSWYLITLPGCILLVIVALRALRRSW